MTVLFRELLERLKSMDEVTVLDLLGITSDELVDRTEDLIEDRQEYIRGQLYGEDEESVDI